MIIREELIRWYRVYKRDLPWRHTQNPYHVWLSEIILQQTRVKQGLPYYEAFVSKFPTVHHLANAHEDEIMLTWQGLGYYSRARNLHTTAKFIARELKGKFPETYTELLKLKGVGEYTAAAIASFCHNEPVAVVDGNVYRVLSRFFDIDTPIDSADGKKYFRDLANELIDKKNPAEFNQAIMEFGAIQCVPKNPACTVCALLSGCLANAKNKIQKLPVKRVKTKVSERYFDFLVITDGREILLEKREANDIWKNLYQFPLIEKENRNSTREEVLNVVKTWYPEFKELHPLSVSVYKHILSHRVLRVNFWKIQLPQVKAQENRYIKTSLTDLEKVGLPRVITRYLDENM